MSFVDGKQDEFCFQAHITTEKLTPISDYIALCNQYHVKPVLIQLDKGCYVDQPMYTQQIRVKNLADALGEVECLKNIFLMQGFSPIRTKIEINAANTIDYFGIDLEKWQDKVYRQKYL